MLVLSRHVNERILIGDDIAVTVVSFTGGKVRLGIEAPPEVRVDREEIAALRAQQPVTTTTTGESE